MSLQVAALNSGSNGNSYYIGHSGAGVLIDAGLSYRETVNRLERLAIDVQTLKAVFISHEHSDHVNGARSLMDKLKLPVYINQKTRASAKIYAELPLIRHISSNETVRVEDITVVSFPKQHDAADPISFVVQHQGVNVGVFTDIGSICGNLLAHFKICHAAFLESNYDEAMLEQGKYPELLKRRIRGGMGHLSNTQALKLFQKHKPAYMSHLFLSHLSENNNDPDLVMGMFKEKAGSTEIVIASRSKETGLFTIDHNGFLAKSIIGQPNKPEQLSLF